MPGTCEIIAHEVALIRDGEHLRRREHSFLGPGDVGADQKLALRGRPSRLGDAHGTEPDRRALERRRRRRRATSLHSTSRRDAAESSRSRSPSRNSRRARAGMTMVHRPTEFDLVVTDAVAPAPAGVEVTTAFAMTPPLSLRTVPGQSLGLGGDHSRETRQRERAAYEAYGEGRSRASLAVARRGERGPKSECGFAKRTASVPPRTTACERVPVSRSNRLTRRRALRFAHRERVSRKPYGSP